MTRESIATARVAMKLGIVTVGQAPRTDLTEDLGDLLGDVDVVEHGALDDLDATGLETIADAARDSLSRNEGIHVLHTRLADGGSIVYLETEAHPRTARAIARAADDGADAVLLACTGTFPKLSSSVPVVYPDRLLQQVTLSVHRGGSVLVVAPDGAQIEDQRVRWSGVLPQGTKLRVHAASPYRANGATELDAVAEALANEPADLVVMDCIGYTRRMRDRLASELPLANPVLTAREVAVRLALAVAG